MAALLSPETPAFAVPEANLVPVSGHLKDLMAIPASRMFLINKSLKVFKEKQPGVPVFDASQGDGGASLPGVPAELLDRAFQMQKEHGTAYDMPYGTDAYRKIVAEQYWKLAPDTGWGPANIIGTQGGRDGLQKAYQAMLALGHGRQGDVVVVSRVPWISYNWGPYGIGANVMWAPGRAEEGWAYSEEGIRACVAEAARHGRKIAGLVITCPDNPTGQTIPLERQIVLARTALEAGVAFVLFDWMYHAVGDGEPYDVNVLLRAFEPELRKRLMVLDGLTKSLGASNIRNCHLLADAEVVKTIVAQASHTVMPSFFSLAVAMAAYEKGFQKAAAPIIEPTRASRAWLRDFLKREGLTHIIGQGYYAFIKVSDVFQAKGWTDSEPMGQYLAEEHGVAVVPGAFFSPYGAEWIRFSYATPPERTQGAAERLLAALKSLQG
ncbi:MULTISPECIES: aminotransferase class I/II-fold pyridoxal phosphate-dependent enzyme [Geothrix]|uniref:aminotransferase class I/II-fold pyridoxal phosphate-dependent enzyme n=1 Tax=Geothrix TaxID=44675 RepID=UPI001FAC2559|nr:MULTISPECIES: pyridoxal phosphate-dependent aminotransferase [Geothrix]